MSAGASVEALRPCWRARAEVMARRWQAAKLALAPCWCPAEWMVLDVNALNRRWQHDLLWIIEQVPGYTQKASMRRRTDGFASRRPTWLPCTCGMPFP